MCGTPVDGVAAASAIAERSKKVPLLIGAVAVVVLAAVLIAPRLRDEPDLPVAPVAAPPGQGLGDPTAIDLSSMTPREAADRLFERVATAAANGDSAQARRFAPMAVSAYQMVPEGLDADAYFHVAIIELIAGRPTEAREAASAILERDPRHLFGLFTAAEAEQLLGDTDAANALYREFLDNYQVEISENRRVEYVDHAPMLPTMRAQAEQAVGGG